MPDAALLLAAYDDQVRRAELTVPEPGLRLDPDGPVVRVTGGRRGLVTGRPDLGVTEPALDALIRRQQDCFAARGEGFEWKTRGHDRPASLPERLLAAGFEAEPRETVMIAALADVATSPPPPGGVVVREARGRADLRRIAALSAEVFGTDEEALAADLIARPDAAVHVVAESGGRLVSAARLEFVPGTGFAGLWGGGTRPGWRGRGLYRALVAHRARLAAGRGVRYLQVDAAEASRPILERLGFTAVTTTTPYTWTPRADR
ncbi:GNAT family N-acetyltransferase [Amycolatopsis sp. PS_44_ISF1]|uniref:GNAT family N-acetyltransferase n=1 Tax=Amycolatopsis sp. PS_44_ISF1 TaxID=2974917 RepID=UPI0028DF7D90|nr:GNAT family N-acetyltransferase [Amycolatopsis sp. PS_44_ISF1]MDT8912659.1 GNAT family N-acetyltransferase [Amycolatopsis sp. PS_44_ISF1]